jgi:hypothetical protein
MAKQRKHNHSTFSESKDTFDTMCECISTCNFILPVCLLFITEHTLMCVGWFVILGTTTMPSARSLVSAPRNVIQWSRDFYPWDLCKYPTVFGGRHQVRPQSLQVMLCHQTQNKKYRNSAMYLMQYERPKEWELIPESGVNICLSVCPFVRSHANNVGGVMYYIASYPHPY